MAVGVVDRLEPVQVEADHRHRPAALARLPQLAAQGLVEVAAVVQAGARVHHGHAVDAVVQRGVHALVLVELQQHAAQAHPVAVAQLARAGQAHVLHIAAVGRAQVAQQHLGAVDHHLGMQPAHARAVDLQAGGGRPADGAGAVGQGDLAAGVATAVDHQAAAPAVLAVQPLQQGDLAGVDGNGGRIPVGHRRYGAAADGSPGLYRSLCTAGVAGRHALRSCAQHRRPRAWRVSPAWPAPAPDRPADRPPIPGRWRSAPGGRAAPSGRHASRSGRRAPPG